MNKELIAEKFRSLQEDIILGLEKLDGRGKFRRDSWSRAEGGGGLTCVMEKGDVIEKGGVNFSAVYGPLGEHAARNLKVEAENFYATGVSIVIHPENPNVPIIHMNVRYFELESGMYWFGGGIDLTPHYIVKEDAKLFHQQLQAVCDKHHQEFYGRFKRWADDYFFNQHRNETRGIGGIFFDRLEHKSLILSKQNIFDFVMDVGNLFLKVYAVLVNKHRADYYDEQQKYWQLVRRGRYVEFNLVYDRGTKFGLETNGRADSILMSLSPVAVWPYEVNPDPESNEAQTLRLLRKNIDWIGQD
ncbi:MAG: oxygen-dependent coproporphyrinogen oxidase [Flavobacteriales bacterium]